MACIFMACGTELISQQIIKKAQWTPSSYIFSEYLVVFFLLTREENHVTICVHANSKAWLLWKLLCLLTCLRHLGCFQKYPRGGTVTGSRKHHGFEIQTQPGRQLILFWGFPSSASNPFTTKCSAQAPGLVLLTLPFYSVGFRLTQGLNVQIVKGGEQHFPSLQRQPCLGFKNSHSFSL